MRLTLISPFTGIFSEVVPDDVEYGDAPLGVLTLASVARDHGHDVTFFDLDYLRRILPRRDFVHAASEYIAAQSADVFGLGSICSSYPLTLRLAKAIRRLRPDATIIIGGPQATTTDIAVLNAVPEIDIVVRGEAEYSLPLLLGALTSSSPLAHVCGITYRGPFGPVRTTDAPLLQDLDAIPDPAWDLDLVLTQRPDAAVEAGRGCPFACEFCSTNDFFRRKYRMKSPDRILRQMRALEERYGFRQFSLVHDMFTVDHKRVEAFCRTQIAAGTPYQWQCSARTDCVDVDLLSLMQCAGCTKVFYGVETASQTIQKKIDKHLDVPWARSIVEATEDLGLASTVALIIGFPDETKQDLRETCDFFVQSARLDHTRVHVQCLAPLPGTPLTRRWSDELTLDLAPNEWSGEAEDRRLIEQFRDLFVNFYSIPVQTDRAFLRELAAFLFCGMLRFRWVLIALHREGGNILDVFERFFQRGATRSYDYFRDLQFAADFLKFVDSLPRTHFPASSVIADFYRAAWLAAPVPVVEGTETQSYNRHVFPVCQRGSKLLCCHGPVVRIVEALRSLESLPAITDALCRIVVGNDGELTEVPELSARVLAMCDGNRQASEIGDYLATTELGLLGVPAESLAATFLCKMRDLGLVCFLEAVESRPNVAVFEESADRVGA